MANSYERIGGFDNYFLLWETENAYMHIAGTYLFEAGPLRKKDGGIDIESIKARLASGLHLIPRYRQKLAYIGSEYRPLWVDDEKFNLDYHVRHMSLPKPGTREQLKEMSAWILQQHLDLTRSLWEIWVIEGLEDDKYSIVAKVHHCMVDGITGVELLTIMMSNSPDTEIPEPKPYFPHPKPAQTDILFEKLVKSALLPVDLMKTASDLISNPEYREEFIEEAKDRMLGLGEYFQSFFHKRSNTPLNKEIGPHRQFDWLSMPLSDLKIIRHAFGGSMNDVVLAIVTAAVKDFLHSRHVNTDNLDFLVLTPVSMRMKNKAEEMGNRVASWTVELPLSAENPVEMLQLVEKQTKELKQSRQALGSETLTHIFEWTPSALLAIGARYQYRIFPWNMVVTNVPGPHFPVYLNGSKMLEAYPHVPLMNNHGLNIALMSYDKRLFWCLNADSDIMPDLDFFKNSANKAFDALLQKARENRKQ